MAALLAATAAVGATPLQGASGAFDVGAFSAARPGARVPDGWAPLRFARIDRETGYSLVADDGVTVVRAEADASASGLTRRVEIDPRAQPILAWRWKVANLVEKSDLATRQGDDYAARIYVAFKYDPARVSVWNRVKYGVIKALYGEYPPHAGISYVWATREPAGTTAWNAYTDRVRMIVVRSGAADLGRWVSESRNVLDDYRAAFDEEPPPISGVAIMTDADGTGERVVAFYGDIRLVGPAR
ncbi:MAG: DUF3047 domain-containing protein [Burkholderiales bacterium]|jgi:hypothetical protein|nr:DUF3047 domain-containing protein [Burkholderiales bacterium]